LKTFIVDSNVALIATGQIGEAWAVVILEEIAKGRFIGISDVFFFRKFSIVFIFLVKIIKAKNYVNLSER
jgi:hypothetical protein